MRALLYQTLAYMTHVKIKKVAQKQQVQNNYWNLLSNISYSTFALPPWNDRIDDCLQHAESRANDCILMPLQVNHLNNFCDNISNW